MAVTTTILPGEARTDGEIPEKPKKLGKLKLTKKTGIVGAVVLVVLFVAGFVGKGLLAGPAPPAPDPKTLAGVVLTLAPITLNLADGRYLKLTLALQLSEAASPEAASGESATAAVPALDGAMALDAAIDVLGRRTYPDLIAPGGRVTAQKALSAQVKKRYPGKVLGVYFTEFLMQ